MLTQTTNQTSKIFNNRYVVKKKISSGSFGVVFHGYDKITKEEVAIKLEKEENEEIKSLNREEKILIQLQGLPGITKLHWAGEEQSFSILVIQLLGKDLAFYMKQMNKFSLKTVILIALQALPLMQSVHIRGVIHRDLKPENILLGLDNDQETLYLVDYGISKLNWDPITLSQFPFRDNKPFIGTTRYASIAAHRGHELGKKDDLESLFFVFVYFLKGQLPWQNLQVSEKERTNSVGEIKMNIKLTQLCQDLPNEFIKIFEYLRSLSYTSDPDYQLIISLINDMVTFGGIDLIDGMFDWTEPHRVVKQPTNKIQSKFTYDFQKNDYENHLKIPRAMSNILQDKIESRVSQKIIWSINEANSIQLSPANKLLVPNGPNKPRSQSPDSDPKQQDKNFFFSNSSVLGSQQGTFSSMRIKYVPSMMNFNGSKKGRVISSLSIEQREKADDLIQDTHDPMNDENFNEEPLWLRYYKIKLQSTNTYFNQAQKFKISSSL